MPFSEFSRTLTPWGRYEATQRDATNDTSEQTGPVLAADGTPAKAQPERALRRPKLQRAFSDRPSADLNPKSHL